MSQPKPLLEQPQASARLARRTLFAGAGAAGALAAVAVVLPGADSSATDVATASEAQGEDGRYRLTAHVQRYYQTARV